LSKDQIHHWIKSCRQIIVELEEKAVRDEVDGTLSGTGAYLARVRLHRRLPSLVPMYEVKVSFPNKGIPKMCRCAETATSTKRETGIAKTANGRMSWFKIDNPSIETSMRHPSIENTTDGNKNGIGKGNNCDENSVNDVNG
jgi:hypothetical protein